MAPDARGCSLPYGFEAAGELLDLRLQRQELRRWALCEAPPEVDHLFASLLLNLNRDVDRLQRQELRRWALCEAPPEV